MTKFLNKKGLVALWNIIKSYFTPVVLYTKNNRIFPTDINTSSLPITLDQSCLNFKKIIIEALDNNNRYVSVTVLNPVDGKSFSISSTNLGGETSNDSWIWIKIFGCKITNNGTQITDDEGKGNYCGERQKGYAADTGGWHKNYCFYITKVLGYNFY